MQPSITKNIHEADAITSLSTLQTPPFGSALSEYAKLRKKGVAPWAKVIYN